MRCTRSSINRASGLPREDVWHLLLQHQWQEPDLQLVSKLLCVSSTISQLVHSTCEGRVRARIASNSTTCQSKKVSQAATKRWQASVLAKSQFWGRWLAKNGRLLADLEVSVEPEAESAITAGLQAAATATAVHDDVTSLSDSRRTRSKGRLVTPAEAAASGPAGGTGQGLLLR